MTSRAISYRPGEWDFWTLYDNGEWEPQTHDVLERFLKPGDLFADVGAWCGPVTLWATSLGARVIAWEPDDEARHCLRINTRDHPVEVRPEAWSSTMGNGWLNPDQYFGDSASRLGEYRREARPVNKVTPPVVFESTFRAQMPALIKVDIEGGEIDILPTLGPLCVKYQVPLLVAWHEPWWTRPVPLEERQSWFTDMTTEGTYGGWDQLLAIPKDTHDL